MVGLHLRKLEMRAAEGTDAMLPLVGLEPRVVVEGADAQMPFVAVEDVLPNPRLALDVAAIKGNQN